MRRKRERRGERQRRERGALGVHFSHSSSFFFHFSSQAKTSKGGESDKGVGKYGEVVAAKTAKEVAKAAAKDEATAINLANTNAAALAAANQRLANAGRRLAGCGKDGACPPPKTPEPVVYVVKSKVIKEAAKPVKVRKRREDSVWDGKEKTTHRTLISFHLIPSSIPIPSHPIPTGPVR